jgi:hypothetical protein
MSEEPTWKDEAISWYASDLHEMGYIKDEDEWNELLNILCDTVQAHLELTPKQEVKLLEKERQ